jgi:pimeloyl-ACP methyl ester carboxylesterase
MLSVGPLVAKGDHRMGTYLLVHGATCGGWVWKRLIPLLRAEGHEVFAPTLTGLGERSHLAHPQIGLGTHIQDVLGVLEYEDLRDVIIVGHSWAGMVVTAVADRASPRLAHLVYLDATVPQDGQSSLDCAYPQTRVWLNEQVQTAGDGWKLMPMPMRDFGLTDEADQKWADSKTTPHPYKTFQDPVHFNAATVSALPRTYIACIGDQPRGGVRRMEAEGMNYLELSARHLGMVTAPQELANLLLALAHN